MTSKANVLRLVLGLIQIPFASCLATLAGKDASLQIRDSQQRLLQKNSREAVADGFGEVLNIPLRRRTVDYAGRYHFLNISIGSPGQPLELFVDTGSSDTWVFDTSYCEGSPSDHYLCYDPKLSKTSEVLQAPPYFQPRYPGQKFQGLYVKDQMQVGPGVLGHAEFGMLHDGKGVPGGGLFALGFDTSEFGPNKTFAYVYPNILDTLYNESVIDSRVFGMFLNRGSADKTDVAGSLVLGGYDRSKFFDPLLSFDVASPSDGKRISVPLIELTATIAGVSTPLWSATTDSNANGGFVPAALDSGDMSAAIPAQAHALLVDIINRYSKGMLNKPASNGKFDSHMECRFSSADISVQFTFASRTDPLTVSIPFADLVLPSPYGDNCLFALNPQLPSSKGPYWLNLGSSILSSMYLIVDYDSNAIRLGKARYDGGSAAIVPVNHR